MKKLNIITLGCSKNTVDSEKIMAQFRSAGYEVEYDSEATGFDTVIINTCGFIADAKEESINTILSCAEARRAGLIKNLFVIGCLSERYRDELTAELPEVDKFFGVSNISEVVEHLGHEWKKEIGQERVLTTPSHYAYLKISEGCDRKCGFCAIPLIRGPHVSVPREEIIREAEHLASKGVKELIVIAQDTTYYGLDIYGERMIAPLMRDLCKVEGIEWIRLHYAYPAGFPDDLIGVMAEEPKICSYLDIPLQHITDSQLRSMKRGNDREQTYGLIRKLRDKIPGIVLRTTLITGYPGETKEDFDALCDFVRAVRFDRLGVFPYSEEEGTYAAEELTDNVPQEVKEQRAEKIISIQAGISEELNSDKIGTPIRVIVDSRENDRYICRTAGDSPEVDQEVYVQSAVPLLPGQFADIEITGSSTYELYGIKHN